MVLSSLVAATLVLTMTPWTASAATDSSGLDRPQSIPALQEWTARDGAYELGANTRIVLRPEDADRLAEVAETFAGDLATVGAGHEIVVSDVVAREHDIVLRLGSTDRKIGAEGYELAVGKSITVKAKTDAGVYYGTRTLLQLFQQDATVPAGQARDYPAYEERGLMVDLARMPFSYDWLVNTIRDMGYLKLNALHLHLTDTEGWRIESDHLAASEGALTKAQMANLVELAARHQITVIPEIDMPSHQGQLLSAYPQYQLVNPDEIKCDPEDIEHCTADGNILGRLDYSIPEARQLLKDIIAEYMDLFPGPYWHIGADEYLGSLSYDKYPQLVAYAKDMIGPDATGYDGYIYFINELNQFVKDHGKQTRMWNDVLVPGTTPQVDTDVVIDWWTDADSDNIIGSLFGGGPYVPYTPQELLDRGYKVLNSAFLSTYTSPPGGHTRAPTYKCLYATFAVTKFFGYLYNDTFDTDTPAESQSCGPMFGGYKTVAEGAEGLLGARVTMWNSTQPGVPPWSEEDGWDDIYPRLRVMAQRTWNSVEYAADRPAFEALISDVGTIPAPALDVSATNWLAPAAGGTTQVSVASTFAKTVSDDADWLTTEVTPGGVTLTAAANPGPASRVATVTISSGSSSLSVGVTQEAPEPPTPADRNVLQEVYDTAKKLSNANNTYTKASWAALQAEIAAARKILDDPLATPAQIDQATTDLNAAIAGLTPNGLVVAKVKLNQSQLRLVKGKSLKLQEGVYYANAHAAWSGKVVWKSSNPKIATVSATGTVKAKKPGTVTITATTKDTNLNGKRLSTSIKVTVVKTKGKAKVTKVWASVPKTIKKGQTVYITGKYASAMATGVKVSYKSSKPSVIDADSAGRLVAKRKGTAKVTIKAAGKTKTYTIKVT